MTKEFLDKAHELFCAAGAAQETAAGLREWADENIIKGGYFIIEIPEKYFDCKFTFPSPYYKEKRQIKVPAKIILKQILERQAEADELIKQFAEL